MAQLFKRPTFAAAFVIFLLSAPLYLNASEPSRLPTAHTFDALEASLEPLRRPDDTPARRKVFDDAQMLLEKGRLFVAGGDVGAAGRIADHLEATIALLTKLHDIAQKEQTLDSVEKQRKALEAERLRLREKLNQLKTDGHTAVTDTGAEP